VNLINRRVSFKILDIYIPAPLDVFLRLHGDDLLEGTIIDFTDDGTHDGKFVVVSVKEMADPVVVPVHCVSEV
jgi:hypothetical protein